MRLYNSFIIFIIATSAVILSDFPDTKQLTWTTIVSLSSQQSSPWQLLQIHSLCQVLEMDAMQVIYRWNESIIRQKIEVDMSKTDVKKPFQ